MSCTNEIAKAITNDCTVKPTGGLESKSWVFNRDDITAVTTDVTNTSIITAITLASGGAQAWPVTGFKKTSNAGYDLVVSDTLPDVYTHYFSLQPWEKDGASLENLASMNNIVVIVEQKGLTTDEGKFQIYGLNAGLYKSSATKRVNDNAGVPTYEFVSQSGEEEPTQNNVFWDTDYATTRAKLVALETPTS